MPTKVLSHIKEYAHIVDRSAHNVLDLFGPKIEFLTSPRDPEAVYCVMVGTIPPGVSVPLHSHADVESFYVLSGSVQVLSQQGDSGDGFEWLDTIPGNFVQVPSGTKHAFRNTSSEPVVQLITTTPKIGLFFQEVGRRTSPGVPLPPPTQQDFAHFLNTAASYHYWNGSPAENAAVGIRLF
jgi:quercetin dioxygenase-like cupin family protein